MIDACLQELKSTSVVVLSYVLVQQKGFIDFVERKGIVYGLIISRMDKAEVKYQIYHLDNQGLLALWERLPPLCRAMSNFYIQDGTVFYDDYVRVLEVDSDTLKLFVGQYSEYEENPDTPWRVLHRSAVVDSPVKLENDNAEYHVGMFRFSDSTPNIVVSVKNSNGEFNSKTVFSLDDSVEVSRVSFDGERYLSLSDLRVLCVDREVFDQVFSVSLFCTLLNFREYYKCMLDAVKVVKRYNQLINLEDSSTSQKREYVPTTYRNNCVIEYSVDKPRISALMKPKDTETIEEFLIDVKNVLGSPEFFMEFIEKRKAKCSLDFAFLPTFNRVLQVNREGGLPAVLQYEKAISQWCGIYRLEVFKWKSAMAYLNEVPACFGNAFLTKFGVLRLSLEEGS